MGVASTCILADESGTGLVDIWLIGRFPTVCRVLLLKINRQKGETLKQSGLMPRHALKHTYLLEDCEVFAVLPVPFHFERPPCVGAALEEIRSLERRSC